MRAVYVAIGAGLVVLAGLLALYVLTPPPDHVSRGCLWWTARPVDQVVPGYRGCIRGYFVSGGGLADAREDPAYALHMDLPPAAACTYRPGDALVVTGEAAFGDGHMVILVSDCR